MPSAEAYGVVAQMRVHALDAVDDLRHPHVDGHAREGESISPVEPMLALYQNEHAVERLRECVVEILVEPECEPAVLGARDRLVELQVRTEVDRHLHRGHR